MIEDVILPNRLVAMAFYSPWVGFGLALGLLVWAAGIIVWNYTRYHRPFNEALHVRLEATRIVEDQSDNHEARAAFAAHYHSIEAAMLSHEGRAKELRHAWVQFIETIVDTSETPLRATTRPEGYFLHLGDDTRVLAWWANIFVALGLTFTFLGIIAALVGAVQAMSGGADMGKMQGALIGLLTITAAKFWTSIGGVFASIILRRFDRKWHSANEQKLEALCDRLEYGTLFSPPQRIAARQLRELEQQSIALTDFSQQLAASIGDALEAKLAPVVNGLGGLQISLGEQLAPLNDIRTSIDDFKSGSLNDFGSKLGDAIKENAGAEMQGLAEALTRMTADLGSVNDRLEGASGEASAQIATAAREFSVASEAMTRAFGDLNGNIDRMATRLADQADEAQARNLARVAEDREAYTQMATGQRDVMRTMGEEMRAASTIATQEMVRAVQAAVRDAMGESQTAIRGALDGFAGATASIQTAFDQMRAQVAALGQALSGSASEAAERNAEVLTRAAAALEAAAAQAQSGLSDTLNEAISRSAEASSQAIAAAFAAFGERFEGASAGLISTLITTAGRMEALAGAIERSTGAASDHAGKIADAGREAQSVSTMLGRAANDVSGAAAPIREAARTISESVGQSQELLRRANEQGERQQSAMTLMSERLERTADSATTAWENYRARFTEVDESLGKALEQIRGASSEHATALNTHVGRIDGALADAANRLGAALEPLAEIGQSLEDVVGRLQQDSAKR